MAFTDPVQRIFSSFIDMLLTFLQMKSVWIKKRENQGIFFSTRMHSSRMRTGRSLTVCYSLLPGGGVLPAGGVWGGGVSAWLGGFSLPGVGGVCLAPGGCLPGLGGVSAWSGGVLPAGGGGFLPGLGGGGSPCRGGPARRTRPWTESQTRVKT